MSGDISIIIAILSLLASTIFNIISNSRNYKRDIQDYRIEIENRSIQQGEQHALLMAIETNVSKITQDNKITNEKLTNLVERIIILERNQENLIDLTKQISTIDKKVEKAHQRIDILEHDKGFAYEKQ